MAQALTIRYSPGDLEPSALSHGTRVILNWRKARDAYWDRIETRQLQEEALVRRKMSDPETLSEFRAAEAVTAATERDRERAEAVEAEAQEQKQRDSGQQTKRAQSQRDANAIKRATNFIAFWRHPAERGSCLVQYAQAAGIIMPGCGISTDEQAQAAIRSLKNPANCPRGFEDEFTRLSGIVFGTQGLNAGAETVSPARTLLGR